MDFHTENLWLDSIPLTFQPQWGLNWKLQMLLVMEQLPGYSKGLHWERLPWNRAPTSRTSYHRKHIDIILSKVQNSSKDVATLNLHEDCNCAMGICIISFVVAISVFCCLVAWTCMDESIRNAYFDDVAGLISLSPQPLLIPLFVLMWMLLVLLGFLWSCHVGETILGFGLWIRVFRVFIAELALRDETYFNQDYLQECVPSGHRKSQAKWQIQAFTNYSVQKWRWMEVWKVLSICFVCSFISFSWGTGFLTAN